MLRGRRQRRQAPRLPRAGAASRGEHAGLEVGRRRAVAGVARAQGADRADARAGAECGVSEAREADGRARPQGASRATDGGRHERALHRQEARVARQSARSATRVRRQRRPTRLSAIRKAATRAHVDVAQRRRPDVRDRSQRARRDRPAHRHRHQGAARVGLPVRARRAFRRRQDEPRPRAARARARASGCRCRTRRAPPRPGERDGVHYHFVDEPQFMALQGPRRVPRARARPRQLVRDVGHVAAQGGRRPATTCCSRSTGRARAQVRRLMPGRRARSSSCRRRSRRCSERLEKRGQDTPEVIARRLDAAREEMRHCGEFDYVIMNQDFATAVDDLSVIVRAAACARAAAAGAARAR